MKRRAPEWEKMFADGIYHQGLISKIYIRHSYKSASIGLFLSGPDAPLRLCAVIPHEDIFLTEPVRTK